MFLGLSCIGSKVGQQSLVFGGTAASSSSTAVAAALVHGYLLGRNQSSVTNKTNCCSTRIVVVVVVVVVARRDVSTGRLFPPFDKYWGGGYPRVCCRCCSVTRMVLVGR